MLYKAYLIMMVPKDVLWWFGTELDDARQIDVTANIDVELGSAQNHRLGSCGDGGEGPSSRIHAKIKKRRRGQRAISKHGARRRFRQAATATVPVFG